jgi:hypothetical protein
MVDNGPPRTSSKKITPLVWIILALLVVLGAVMIFGANGVYTTPSGSKMPEAINAKGDASGKAPAGTH